MVDRPFTISYDELVAMATTEDTVTLQCVSNEVGGNLVGNAVWQGVPLAELLERAGVQDGATQIVGRSVDDFTAGFPTEVGLDGRTALVAVGMNGEPLPAVHGFPARLVVAGLYGYVSATKWLREIELTTWEDFDGYWVPRGWSKEGPIKTMSRIDVPRSGATLDAGPQAIAGVAWAPPGGIEKVEVQVDDDGDVGPGRPRRRHQRQHVGPVEAGLGRRTGRARHPRARHRRGWHHADRGPRGRRRPTAPPAGTAAPSRSREPDPGGADRSRRRPRLGRCPGCATCRGGRRAIRGPCSSPRRCCSRRRWRG